MSTRFVTTRLVYIAKLLPLQYTFPGGKKLAVTINLNVELFQFGDDTVLQGRNGMLGKLLRCNADMLTNIHQVS